MPHKGGPSIISLQQRFYRGITRALTAREASLAKKIRTSVGLAKNMDNRNIPIFTKGGTL